MISRLFKSQDSVPIKSKLQHPPPPPRANPGHLNFWKLDCSNSRPLGPKWLSNALPYGRFCLWNWPLLKNNLRRLLSLQSKIMLFIHALKALHNFWRPFFVSQSLTNVLSLPLNSSILSKHVFIATSDFGARKRKSLQAWHFWFNFPYPTQVKVKFPTLRAQEVVKCPGFPPGGDVKVSIWSVHKALII